MLYIHLLQTIEPSKYQTFKLWTHNLTQLLHQYYSASATDLTIHRQRWEPAERRQNPNRNWPVMSVRVNAKCSTDTLQLANEQSHVRTISR